MVATHDRSRQPTQIALGLAAGIVAVLLGCGPPGLASGVWLSAEGPERWALTFKHAGGLISGTMHLLRDGKEVAQWGFAGTRRGADGLELNWVSNNRMSLTVDLSAGELWGTAVLGDGSVHEALFRRTTATEVPGLVILPELPYRLRPPSPGSGWEVAAPADVGIDPGHLEATVRAVTRGEAGLLHSLVVVRHGKLLLEEYFHGYSRDDLHQLRSVTKSVSSLLVGIARDRGEIGGLDIPVLQWFPEYAAAAGAGWEGVTLRHLLTMTAGLDWDRREAIRGPPAGPPLFQLALKRPVVDKPGTRFLYNNHDVELLSGVLRHATGMHADEYAMRTLFAQLGIKAWDWELGRTEGYPAVAGNLQLRPLDMAKIGQLVLDRGRWRAQQVVSEEWIAESTRIAAGLEAERYGYLWTRLETPPEAGGDEVITASGSGSQFIHVVPALGVVVVTTGGNLGGNKQSAIGDVLLRHLVPGIERL
jgi:CubicO group peptidase (beta-lactamase class C family)